MVVAKSPDQLVVLENVSWETFERLLTDKGERSAPRFTYDGGMLEIMSPAPEHEIPNRTLNILVELLAIELDVNVASLGSTTFKRPDLLKGFEPDSCFYIQNEPAIRGKRIIDLLIDPPPDLVIEVDITSYSLDRFPIFAAVCVPEVWRYDGKRVLLYELQEGKYQEITRSLAFPILTSAVLNQFLDDSESLGRVEWAKRLRAWVHAQQSGG